MMETDMEQDDGQLHGSASAPEASPVPPRSTAPLHPALVEPEQDQPVHSTLPERLSRPTQGGLLKFELPTKEARRQQLRRRSHAALSQQHRLLKRQRLTTGGASFLNMANHATRNDAYKRAVQQQLLSSKLNAHAHQFQLQRRRGVPMLPLNLSREDVKQVELARRDSMIERLRNLFKQDGMLLDRGGLAYYYRTVLSNTWKSQVTAFQADRKSYVNSKKPFKRVLWEEQLRSAQIHGTADKPLRFRVNFAAERMDFEPSLIVKLHQVGFSVNDSWQSYDSENEDFLSDIDAGVIPSCLDQASRVTKLQYFDGCLLLELQDYRYVNPSSPDPSIRRLLLRPHMNTVIQDVEILSEMKMISLLPHNDNDVKIAMETRIQRALFPRPCLSPSVRVMQIANLANFNRRIAFANSSRIEDSVEYDYDCLAAIQKVEPSSAHATCLEHSAPLPSRSPKTTKTLSILRHAHLVHCTESLRRNSAHNYFANHPALRSTVLKQGPVPSEHIHPCTWILNQRIEQDSDTARQGTLSINISGRLRPSSKQRMMAPVRKIRDVRRICMQAHGMAQSVELNVYHRRSAVLRGPDPDAYDGKLTFVCENSRDVRTKYFQLGGATYADHYVENFMLLLQRDGWAPTNESSVPAKSPRLQQDNAVVYLGTSAQDSTSRVQSGAVDDVRSIVSDVTLSHSVAAHSSASVAISSPAHIMQPRHSIASAAGQSPFSVTSYQSIQHLPPDQRNRLVQAQAALHLHQQQQNQKKPKPKIRPKKSSSKVVTDDVKPSV